MISARRLRRLALSRTPEYFAVLKTHSLSTAQLQLPDHLLGGCVYVVELDEADLPNPAYEPIAIFGDGKGDRRYLWRDGYWAEFPLHTLPLLEMPGELGDIVACLRSTLVVNPVAYATWRVLYRLPDSEQCGPY